MFAATSLVFFIALPPLWIRFLFVDEACLLEGGGVMQSLRRSESAGRGRSASLLGALLGMLLAEGGSVLVAEQLGQGIFDQVLQLGTPMGTLFSDGGSPFALLGLFASAAYVATARFLFFIDARTRADGWDVQVRLMAIAAKEAT